MQHTLITCRATSIVRNTRKDFLFDQALVKYLYGYCLLKENPYME